MNKEHYNSIDGVRAIACLGIVFMHIKANTDYMLNGFVFETFIPSLTWFVYLFLIISGFGMSVGYLNKFQTNSIDLESFYKKRYEKTVPYFAFLLIIALIMERSLSTVYEASIEVLMIHGLLPNNAVQVLGVCWTLGVIFLFYFLFPVFSVLMKTKKRAWITLIVSLWVNFVCSQYFFGDYYVTESFAPRHSFIYCAPLFIVGGLIFLYREDIKKWCGKYRWIMLALCIILTVLWYVIPSEPGERFDISFLKTLIVFTFWLAYVISVDSIFLSNKMMRVLGGISMEIYLTHMIIFRVVEKTNLYLFGNTGFGGWISYLLVCVLVVIGTIIFIHVYKMFFNFIKGRLKKIPG